MQSVLIITEAAPMVAAFRNNLQQMQRHWHMLLANSAADARKLLASESFDLIVCDTQLSDVMVTGLLREACRLQPDSIRIALSASPEDQVSLDCARVVHHIIPRVVDRELLRTSLQRSQALREIAVRPAVKAVLPDTSDWMQLPALYQAVTDAVASPDGSIESAARLVDENKTVSRALLDVLNSEFFAHSRDIGSVDQASYLLGFDLVRSVLLTHLFFAMAQQGEKVLRVDRLVHHGLYAGSLARRIARMENLPPHQADRALLAGAMQSAGMLILSRHDPSRYRGVVKAVSEKQESIEEAETRAFGCNHAEVGCRLLSAWGCADSVIEAVAYQHQPGACRYGDFGELSAVYAASALLRPLKYPVGTRPPDTVDTRYLLRVASAAAMAQWKANADLPIQAVD